MPWASNRGVRIYWEEEGSGDPLVMIMGLSLSLAMWGELRPFLSRHFRLILMDNRCVGKSDAPFPPFTLAEMARDTIAVMDAADIAKAHLLGFSMGGMIAQEVAFLSPARVDRLTLACTHCGGLKASRANWDVLFALISPVIHPETKLRKMIGCLYHPNTPVERVEHDIRTVQQHNPTVRGFLQQLAAIVAWHSWSRLPAITAETLVIHGDSDCLIPPENAHILADRIPNSHLVIVPNAGHMFPTDQPELTRQALTDFLVDAKAS